MSCPRDSRTKSSHTGQDLVDRLRPHEGLGSGIAEGNVGKDRGFERRRAPMRPALDLFVGEQGEPAFDEIEPGTTGRREVEMEPALAGQPAVNHRRLVGAVVIENQVHAQIGRARPRRSCRGTYGTRWLDAGDAANR